MRIKSVLTLVLVCWMSVSSAKDMEPTRQMPASVPAADQSNKFKLNFAYSFDQEDNSELQEVNSLHNLRFKISWQRYHGQWLYDLNLETFQRHGQNNPAREQYLNALKLAQYRNDFNYRFAKGQWEKDRSHHYDSLSNFTTGLGRNFLMSSHSSFSGELGLGYRHNDTLDNDLAKHKALTTAGLFYKHQFNPMISCEQNLSYELAQDHHILRGKSALNFSLNKNYFAQASYHIKRQDDLSNTHTDSRISLGLEHQH